MKVRDDIVTLEPITQKEALKALLTLHNLLQYENSCPKHLDTIRKIRNEVWIDLNFRIKQTAIDLCFRKMRCNFSALLIYDMNGIKGLYKVFKKIIY